jgi:hypothetical protein
MTARKAAQAESTLADKLLDAQVKYLIGEISGKKLAATVRRDVTAVLDFAATVTLEQALEPDELKKVGRRLLSTSAASAGVERLVPAVADAVYDMPAGDFTDLGAVVGRPEVEALIAKLLSMSQLHDRALDKLTESPLIAVVASKFATKLVGDFLAQNRAKAEKVPGVGGLLKVGASAANRVKSPFDKQLDAMLGDAAGKGAAGAMKRTNKIVKELIDEAPLHDAAMEVWDLHADAPMADLRHYLSKADNRELVVLVYEVIASARETEFAGHIVDMAIDTFFEQYGSTTLAQLLEDFGVTKAHLVEDIVAIAPSVIEAAKASGALESILRAQLEPFFHSAAVTKLLDSAGA